MVSHNATKVEPSPKVSRQSDGNLTDLAYTAIRDDIISCALRPGEEISEGLLGARYGFSKAPMRAALMRLRQERLVVSRGRMGNMVAPITLRDVQEVFQLRLLVEVESTRLAAGKVDPPRLKKLDKAVHVGYTPGDKSSEQAYLRANRAFHRYVAGASGNQRLAAMVVELLEQHERIVHLGLALQNREHAFHHHHDELVTALIEGDGVRAVAVPWLRFGPPPAMQARSS